MLAATVQNSWRQYLVPDSEFFGIGEKLIERGAIQQFAAQDEARIYACCGCRQED